MDPDTGIAKRSKPTSGLLQQPESCGRCHARRGVIATEYEYGRPLAAKTLASELGPDGITVNYVQPGAIMTPASRRVFKEDKDLRDYCIGRSAARRLGEPVDVAKVALFLASDDAVFVSGSGVVVDGGANQVA